MPALPFDTAEAADARSAELWTVILGRDRYAPDITAFLYGRRWRTGSSADYEGLPPGVDHVIEVPARDTYLDTLLRADQMTADEVYALVELYEAWSASSVYALGDIRSYGGTLWRCVQAHVSQVDWHPDAVPALWTACAPAGVVPEWIQPTGAQDAYALDDLVTHNGRVWRSLIDANTYEPGVIGTWRDQSVPPLWVAPSGGVGLWLVNDEVEFNGHRWRNTVANNTFAPGVFGWQDLGAP